MEKERKPLQKAGDIAAKIHYWIAIVSALALLVMIGYEVIARYVLHISLMGIEELMLFPIIWLYMMGGCGASYEKSHIECGILTLYMKKERTIRIFELVKRTLCVIILAWLCRWTVFYFGYSFKTWKLGDITNAPLFFANIALTIGFFGMLAYAVRDEVSAVKGVIALKKLKEEEAK